MSQNILLEGNQNVDFDTAFSNASGKRRKKRDAKRAARRRRRAEREANRQAKRLKRRQEGKGFFRKVWKGIKRFNPLSSAARAGTLAIFRLNMFGLATRLYPAFLSDAEISKRKFKKPNAQRARSTWKNLSDTWERKLGGKAKNLEHAIKAGYDKPIFRKNKKRNFVGDGLYTERTSDIFEGMGTQYMDAIFEQIEGADGKPSLELAESNISPDEMALMGRLLGDYAYEGEEKKSGVIDPATASLITAGLGFVSAVVVPMLNKGGLDKNPYEGGTEEGDDYTDDLEDAEKEGDMTPPPADEKELARIYDAAKEDIKKGGEDEDQLIAGVPNTVLYVGSGLLGLGLLFWGISAVLKKTKGK